MVYAIALSPLLVISKVKKSYSPSYISEKKIFFIEKKKTFLIYFESVKNIFLTNFKKFIDDIYLPYSK